MLDRRIGSDAVWEISRQGSLAAGSALLAGTIYGGAATVAGLEQAERQIMASLALQLRVLAAWLPGEGAGLLRVLAGWFELANLEDRLAYLAGGSLWEPVSLGVLAWVWDSAAQAQDPAELRGILSGSSWGEPGGDQPQEISLGLRFGWARRVTNQVPEARAWAGGAAAIVLASELFLSGREPAPSLVPEVVLGVDWTGAGSLSELRERLPPSAGWSLVGIDEPEELWRAEPRWWTQVGRDAQSMLSSGWQGRAIVVGVVGLLALDAVRVGSALAVASGAGSAGQEVLDALF